MPDTAYNTYDTPEDIQLCLSCPYTECNNCLRETHDNGVRPEHRYEDRMIQLTKLIKSDKYPLWTAARMAHSSLATAKRLYAKLAEAGEL